MCSFNSSFLCFSFWPKACKTFNSLLKYLEKTVSITIDLQGFCTHLGCLFLRVFWGEVFWGVRFFWSVFRCGAVFSICVGAMSSIGAWCLIWTSGYCKIATYVLTWLEMGLNFQQRVPLFVWVDLSNLRQTVPPILKRNLVTMLLILCCVAFRFQGHLPTDG